MKRWDATRSEGESWWVEIETDCFNVEDGPIVSIWTENVDPEDDDGRPVQTLVTATAKQAREMAAHLAKCADALDARRNA